MRKFLAAKGISKKPGRKQQNHLIGAVAWRDNRSSAKQAFGNSISLKRA
jgi:hypothetical protein